MAPPLITEVADDAEELARLAVGIIIGSDASNLVLAGGRTPRRTYELLARSPLDPSVDAYLSDERCVPEGDERSNSKMLREVLGGSLNLHLLSAGADCRAAAEDYSRTVQRALPFELAVLGIGEDGHTASLFPDDPLVDRYDAPVVFVPRSDGPDRITMTFACLSQCRDVLFLVSGAAKASAVRALVEGTDIPAAKVDPMRSRTLLVTRDALVSG